MQYVNALYPYFLHFQCHWQRMAVGGEQGVAWQQVGVAADSSIRAGVSDPCTDGALHASPTGKGILDVHVCFWVIMGCLIYLYFLCFVQVRSAYSVPDSPLRASNSSPTSHNNCKSVDILTCVQTHTDRFLDLTFNVLLRHPLGCRLLVILTGSVRQKTPPPRKLCPVHLLLLHGFDRYSGNGVTGSFALKIAQRWGQR